MSNDFVIENGVLTKYVGDGGNIVIPSKDTAIMNSLSVKLSSKCTIYAPIGSNAEAYAKENGLIFIAE